MKLIDYTGGSPADVMDRRLRASDLPRPTTNRQAEQAVKDDIAARQRGLLRVSGFGDAEGEAGDVATAGGAAAGGFSFGSDGGIGRAVMVGVGITVGASLALRLIDSMFGGKRGAE